MILDPEDAYIYENELSGEIVIVTESSKDKYISKLRCTYRGTFQEYIDNAMRMLVETKIIRL